MHLWFECVQAKEQSLLDYSRLHKNFSMHGNTLEQILIPQILLKFFTSLVYISYIYTMGKCNIEQPKLKNILRTNQNFTWPLWGDLLSTFVEQKCFMLYLTLEWFCSYFKFHTTTVIIDKRKVKILFFEKGF